MSGGSFVARWLRNSLTSQRLRSAFLISSSLPILATDKKGTFPLKVESGEETVLLPLECANNLTADRSPPPPTASPFFMFQAAMLLSGWLGVVKSTQTFSVV